MTKSSKILCIAGIVLLFIMAGFHGSGYFFIMDIMNESNAESFLKEIFPVLFIHPSIHLVGLAIFGILGILLSKEGHKVLILVAALVLVDASIAFLLSAWIPGMMLLVAASCFAVAGFRN